jgi:hypothetical protein
MKSRWLSCFVLDKPCKEKEQQRQTFSTGFTSWMLHSGAEQQQQQQQQQQSMQQIAKQHYQQQCTLYPAKAERSRGSSRNSSISSNTAF